MTSSSLVTIEAPSVLKGTPNEMHDAVSSESAPVEDNPDWSFARLKRSETLWGPHGCHRYPAKFIPQLVRRIVDDYSTRGTLVGDVFLGSGTTGIEALRAGRRFWGADINPVAVLISRAKCLPLDPDELGAAWKRMDQLLAEAPVVGRRALTADEQDAIKAIYINTATSEQRLAYWFPVPYRTALAYILEHILLIRDGPARTFFLCAFSNVLRRCSIWLSGSTKPQKDLGKKLSDPVEAFRVQVRGMLRRNSTYWTNLRSSGLSPATVGERIDLEVADARHLPLDDGQLDLLVTSPPYATCYNYIDLHQLTQLWYERYDILSPSNPRQSCIGSEDLSAHEPRQGVVEGGTGSPTADAALQRLAERATGSATQDVLREVRALRFYFQDMAAAMQEFARVVGDGKRLALVIGDSYKRGIMIPTSTALCEMATIVGFTIERRIVRRIPGRVLTSTRDSKSGRFSSTIQSDIQAYPEEDILIFRR